MTAAAAAAAAAASTILCRTSEQIRALVQKIAKHPLALIFQQELKTTAVIS